MGGLELSWLVPVGACEAALDVTEQLGLEQRLRQTGTVDRREDMAGARTARVDRARDDFLPDPAFTRDENLRVRPCDAVDLLLEGGDFGAAAGQLDV